MTWHLHDRHSTKKPVTTMLAYPWKCTVLHCNHLGNTWKPLVLITQHFDYCPSDSEGDKQSVRSPAPVVSRFFPGGYNVKLYISKDILAWWLLAFLHSETCCNIFVQSNSSVTQWPGCLLGCFLSLKYHRMAIQILHLWERYSQYIHCNALLFFYIKHFYRNFEHCPICTGLGSFTNGG